MQLKPRGHVAQTVRKFEKSVTAVPLNHFVFIKLAEGLTAG